MRTFRLHRLADPSGISGTGDVAQGVVFDDGTVAMRWLSDTASTVMYGSVKDLLRVHGHGGSTQMRFDLPEHEDITQSIRAALQVSRTACLRLGHDWDIADAMEAIQQVMGSSEPRSFFPSGAQLSLISLDLDEPYA